MKNKNKNLPMELPQLSSSTAPERNIPKNKYIEQNTFSL